MPTLSERLQRIEDRIVRACQIASRKREDVRLIAVSKTVPSEAIREAYELGLRHFGESRLQEAMPKIEALPKDIVWHFVGKLQSNKARKAAEVFQVLHTLESDGQLRELAKLPPGSLPPPNPLPLRRLRSDKGGGALDCLIEINIGREPQKSGLLPEGLDRFLESVLQCPQVRFRGLMAIGPAQQSAEEMRPYFRSLRKLGESVGAEWLSMGMSGDFDVAIQEGATHIRVGTALFGERSP